MNDVELAELIDAWAYYQDHPEDPNRENYWWAVSEVNQWSIPTPSTANPDSLWRFIMAAYKRDISDFAFENLAAGPLESLLARWGPDYIQAVEELASKDPRFHELLCGVWQNLMTEEIWKRVQMVKSTAY